MDVSGTIGAVLNQKSREIYSVSPTATVFEAVKLMDEKNVGALLVMEGEKLVGIISERDYTRKIMLRGKRSRETGVAEIMSTSVTVTHPQRAGCDLSSPYDRQTHSPFACARWRQSRRHNFDRRPGETRDFMSASCHCASGKLHPGRIHRGVISPVIPSEVEGSRMRYLKIVLRGPSTPLRSARDDGSHSFQTVLPRTIVRTARPLSFHPSKGEFREAD